LIGCGTALNNPSWQASVGDMVPRDVLSAAVTLNSVNFNITLYRLSVGPAIGGAIVARLRRCRLLSRSILISYIALIFVIARWRPDLPKSALPRETMGRAINDRSALRGHVAAYRNGAVSRLLLRRNHDYRSCRCCRWSRVTMLQGDALHLRRPSWVLRRRRHRRSLFDRPSVRDRMSTEWVVRGGFLGFAFQRPHLRLKAYRSGKQDVGH
jgi:hypothetical protein